MKEMRKGAQQNKNLFQGRDYEKFIDPALETASRFDETCHRLG